MIAALSAPAPDTPTLLIAAVVVGGTFYVCVFEIGVPCLRHWWAGRRPDRLGREAAQERAARAALRPPRDIEVSHRG